MLRMLLPFAIVTFVFVTLAFVMLLASYRAVRPGTALVVTGADGARRVLLEGGVVVIPGRATVSWVGLLPRRLSIPFDEDDALLLADAARASFTMALSVRVDASAEAVRALVDRMGSDGTEDRVALRRLVEPELRSAMASAAKALTGAPSHDLAEALRSAVPPTLAGLHVEEPAIEALSIVPA